MPYSNKCEYNPYVQKLSLRAPKRNVHVPKNKFCKNEITIDPYIQKLSLRAPKRNVHVLKNKFCKNKNDRNTRYAKCENVESVPDKPFVEGSMPVLPETFQIVAIIDTPWHILRGLNATNLQSHNYRRKKFFP